MLEGNTKGAILVVTYGRWHTTTYIGVGGNFIWRLLAMKKIFIILFSLVHFTSIGQVGKTEREGEPDIYAVDSDDKEMNEAIKMSRLSYDKFLASFTKPKRNQTSFCVKMPFATKNGSEHIWLVDLESQDGKLIGQVNNLPESVIGLKLGDKIEIEKDKISDWFYIEDGILVGGLTIRVLRDRMTPSERKQFDIEFGVRFE
ncbi:MAG: DUF2314 domain-containing protein [Cyclobacteriaceae bacterium]